MSILMLLFGFIVFSCAGVQQEPIQFTAKPYYFDAGGSDSELHQNSILLTPDFTYSEGRGYGWTTPGHKEFYNEGAEDARNSFLVDGIVAKEISFKADVPEGEWWLAIWFESGMEDSSTTQLFINNENANLEVQSFTPPAEPRDNIQKIYRVIQRRVSVSDKGLAFSMKGVEDDVYLLGISLIPNATEFVDEKTSSILKHIEKLGNYKSTDDFQPVIDRLKEIRTDKKHRNFAAYWIQQLEIIRDAEMYFDYRGWGWATDKTGLGLFGHLHQSVMLYDGVLNFENVEESPLYERALWYRGRVLYWLHLERGIYAELNGAKRDLAKMYKLHPADELVRMYNGEQIDTPDEFDNITKPANAPQWALSQWELTNRLKKVVDWWVNEQQSENGEFGGKFGDDVEILRWWSPLILSGDETTYKGWKKLADGVWNSNKVKNGYAKKPSDVEHSSEFISDTAPLLVLFNDDPKYAERLAYSADYFQNLWTGYNDNGNRFFKSAWFSSSEIETEEPKNRDVIYNGRAVKAVRYYAWKTGDAPTKKALIEWADSWYKVSQETSKGKPVGIIPPSVEFPTENINGDEPTWHEANMYWSYFDWRDGKAILDQLLYTWTFTADDKYLKPIFQSLELVRKYASDIDKPQSPHAIGSEGWAAHRLGNRSGFWNVVETWRTLTGDDSYDDLILKYGTPYTRYRITKDEQHLVDALEPYLETVRYNEPMRSSEAIHTDRVFIKGMNTREATILLGMITGFAIEESASPYIATSWENTSRDLTYLVSNNDSTSLDVKLYNFADDRESATMRVWQLRSGEYTLTKKVDGKEEKQQITVKKGGDRFKIYTEPKKLIEISIKPTNK